MKIIRIIGLIFILSILYSCNNDRPTTGGEYNIANSASAQTERTSSKGIANIEFNESEFNFGTVIQGEKVTHKFKFTNTGSGNLIISNVTASCGCAVPQWSKEPVKANGNGYIEVIFDSSNKEGKQTKTINVFTNSEPNVSDLIIHCDIIK